VLTHEARAAAKRKTSFFIVIMLKGFFVFMMIFFAKIRNNNTTIKTFVGKYHITEVDWKVFGRKTTRRKFFE
jgi:hypothetical protein